MNFRDTIGFGKEAAASVSGANSSIMAYAKGILDAVRGIGTAGGAAVNRDCMDDNDGGALTPTTGAAVYTTQTGTWASTSALDGTYHNIIHSTNANITYEFRCGGGVSPVALVWTGYVGSTSARTVSISAWDYDTGAWQVIGTITGQNNTVNVVKNIVLYSRHMGDGSAAGKPLGKVFIRLLGTTSNSMSINTDQVYVTYAVTSRSVGYAEGAVWVDTGAGGTAGTELYVNGTADKPVKTIADAITIATTLGGIKRLRIINGSSIAVPAAGLTNYTLDGANWSLDLATYAISGCVIRGAVVTGVSTGTGSDFEHCVIGTCTLGSADFVGCDFTGTLTTIASGSYTYHDCIDGIPGTSNPHFILTANTILGIRNWRGGIEFEAIAATNTIAIDGAGRIVLHTDCSGGTLIIRGPFSITDEVATGWVAGTSGALTDSEKLIGYTGVGSLQIARTTESLNQAAASYDLFTGTTQAVILESLSVKMPTGAAGGALTSISIQTDDATPGVIISAANGAVANLTSEAEISWTGCMLVNVGTKIQLTIAGGAHGGAYVATITAQYRSVILGGYLA
jgi:hypothetical protein